MTSVGMRAALADLAEHGTIYLSHPKDARAVAREVRRILPHARIQTSVLHGGLIRLDVYDGPAGVNPLLTAPPWDNR
jgi:hypothetical protein